MNDRTPDPGQLTYTRVFDAPRELVFRCMIEPGHLTHFWGPAGVSTPLAAIKVDPRPGGIFETVMVNDADGSQYTMRAEYVEIVQPERIVWTEPGTGMTTTSTFSDLGDGRTEVQIRQTNVPLAARSPEARAGFSTSLDRFAAYLGQLVLRQNEARLQPAVAAEFLSLADLLAVASDEHWDTQSLCEGWRVREVIAHLTMAARYSEEEFMAKLQSCDFDFTRLSNEVASQDACLPADKLVACLRSDVMQHWTPPGGGYHGALNHVVIHGLDVTVPLGVPRRSPDETIRVVLDDLTQGGGHAHFGVDIQGRNLQASDLEWSHGSGPVLRGAAGDLALAICGRAVPDGRIEGEPLRRT